MEQGGVAKPRFLQVVRAQSHARAALCGHAAPAVGPDHDGDDAGRLGGPDRPDLNPTRFEVTDQPAPGVVLADAGHQAHRFAGGGGPRAEVGSLAASPDRYRGG